MLWLLSLVTKHPGITALEPDASTDLTERVVRKPIAGLYDDIYEKMEGRGIRYRINPILPLRKGTRYEIDVGSFLESLGWRDPWRQPKKKNDDKMKVRSQKDKLVDSGYFRRTVGLCSRKLLFQ